jgi:hypothetical protein
MTESPPRTGQRRGWSGPSRADGHVSDPIASRLRCRRSDELGRRIDEFLGTTFFSLVDLVAQSVEVGTLGRLGDVGDVRGNVGHGP